MYWKEKTGSCMRAGHVKRSWTNVSKRSYFAFIPKPICNSISNAPLSTFLCGYHCNLLMVYKHACCPMMIKLTHTWRYLNYAIKRSSYYAYKCYSMVKMYDKEIAWIFYLSLCNFFIDHPSLNLKRDKGLEN